MSVAVKYGTLSSFLASIQTEESLLISQLLLLTVETFKVISTENAEVKTFLASLIAFHGETVW